MITDFGRTHNLVGMSNLQAQAQDQASENTRADVLLAATRGYFDVLRAQAVLKVAQQTVAARQLVFDQISALAQSQLRTELDVSFANVNLSDAKLLQLQAENGINSAKPSSPPRWDFPNQTTFDVADEPMPAALPAQADPLIAQAMQNRPDLKDLQLLQSAAERFTRAEHDLYYPTVSALAAAGGVPAGVSQVPDHYAAAGINVNIPIFNGGLFKARESEASLKAKAAAQNVADLANRITRDVRVAWLNATTALQRVSLTQQFVAQAQLALDLADSRYRLGLSSIVELSQAQLNLTSAQIESATAHYDYQAQRSVVDSRQECCVSSALPGSPPAEPERQCRIFRSCAFSCCIRRRRRERSTVSPTADRRDVVVDGDLPFADHLKAVTRHNDGRAFRNADSQQLRVLLDQRNNIIPAVACIDVLIDRDLAQEGEAVLVLWLGRHHEVRTRDCSAHQIVALNGGARGTSADHAAALQHLPEFRRVRVLA